MVTTQAQTIFLATPQRTAENLLKEPIPTIPPVIVCVVLTGIPSQDDMNKEAAAPDSAQKPSKGLRRVTFCPMVFTMRQPPLSVPKAMAKWHNTTIDMGMKNVSPAAKRAAS